MKIKSTFLKLFFTYTFALCVHVSFAQMVNGTDTLYGNEWLNYTQSYYKIPIAQNGIYRLTAAQLQAAGIPINTLNANQFQLFCRGREVPIFVHTEGGAVDNNFIEFYGEKNKTQLDTFLYKNGSQDILNLEISAFTDTAIYYLTWQNAPSSQRYSVQANTLLNLPEKETAFLHTLRYNYNQALILPQLGGGVSLPEFEHGEGYGSNFTPKFDLVLTPTNRVNNQGGVLSMRYVTDLGNHITEIKVNNALIGKDTAGNYVLRDKKMGLNAANMSASIPLSITGTFDPTDYYSVAAVSLTYAHTFNFENQSFFEFNIAASDAPKYLEIENFNAGSSSPILYDVTNKGRMVTTLENGKVRVLLPPSVFERKLVLSSQTAIKNETNIKPIVFTDLKTNGGNFIFISPKRFIPTVKNYADYRATQNGGSFKPIVVDMQQLTEQFAYGVQGHPLAIRNFSHFIRKNWDNPQYILLIGKTKEYPNNRNASNEDVPTWGAPASDLLFTATHNSDVPTIPIGRIAATTTADLTNYLEKVKELEANQRNAPQTLADREWFKNVLHLNGGRSESEIINGYMNGYAAIITDSKIGSKVTSFRKFSTDPVQVAISDGIYDRLNKGVAFMTFFGHSSTSVLDFDINNPDFFTNRGKYPLFSALGCTAGNVFQTLPGLSENYVFYPQKGMSAFLGTSGNSFLESLNHFSRVFYDHIGNKSAGKSIGNLIKNTIADLGDLRNNIGLKVAVQELILNGDPALILHPASGPDFVIDAASVKKTPEILESQLDSFTISMDVVNIGTVVKDSMFIKIRRKFADNTVSDIVKLKIPSPAYRRTLTFTMSLEKDKAVGQNTLFIEVDAENNIAEQPASAENNNQLISSSGEIGYPFFVITNSVKTAFPTPLSILSKTPLILKAFTTNALAKLQNYILEIDTTEKFDSPFKQRTTLNQKGGVLRWQPQLNWRDSTVYYWRVATDNTTAQNLIWDNASFIYLKNAPSEGWNQSHLFQYKNNNFNQLQLSEAKGGLEFSDFTKIWEMKQNTGKPAANPFFFLDFDYGGEYDAFPEGGIYVVVYDSLNITAWINYSSGKKPHQYGIFHPKTYDTRNFAYDMSDTTWQNGRTGLIDFLNNTIPSNNYVMFFTVQRTPTSSYNAKGWAADSARLGTTIFNILEKQGAKMVRSLAGMPLSLPYLFIYKKDKGVLLERIGNSFEEGINAGTFLTGRQNAGSLETKLIGPAQSWQSFHARYKITRQGLENDSTTTDIWGVQADGITSVKLFSDIKNDSISLSTVDAKQYPYLKLSFKAKDAETRTAPQVRYWRVFYTGFTDLAVNPAAFYEFNSDTLPSGDSFRLKMAVENMSTKSVDSISVKLTAQDEQNNTKVFTEKLSNLAGETSQNVQFKWDTNPLSGKYDVLLEVNPNNEPAELRRDNNVLQTRFYVEKDERNPLLDVTFDGVRIMNNDIVSSKPTILMALRDENRFLALADTALIKAKLEYPNGQRSALFFNDPNLRFTPARLDASGKNNKATLEYRPVFTQDGTYRLVVNARDASGNTSGASDYVVSFQVVTKSALSNLLPYPNPFSTATRFAYTLTGDTPPQYFRIQILTISGKVVREITQNEIGQLKIGTHLTDFVWDGTDDFGQKLANGVYLYRVVAKNKDGKAFENFETNTNTYFKKGFGKIVILR